MSHEADPNPSVIGRWWFEFVYKRLTFGGTEKRATGISLL
jgi:hypothetical protein